MCKSIKIFFVLIFATALNVLFYCNILCASETVKDEIVQEQQDIKRKEQLDDMQMQAQKRKLQLEKQNAEINKNQGRLGQESANSPKKINQ